MEEIKFVLSQVCPEEVRTEYEPSNLGLTVICIFQEAEKIVSVLDKNGDGFISYTEFRCLLGANMHNKTNSN